jgi:hypothetical protein
MRRTPYEDLADVRDGLTRLERVILVELARAEQELPGRHIATAMLYGRVVEHVNVGVAEFQRALGRVAGSCAVQCADFSRIASAPAGPT